MSGRCINPLIVHGQTHGAIAQGVGQALWELCFLDPASGQPLAGSLMDYGMPRADTLPPFATEIAEVLSPTNPLGIKAGGEGGTTAAPAVVISAIADALRERGVSHLAMPATPYNVWTAIQRAGGGSRGKHASPCRSPDELLRNPGRRARISLPHAATICGAVQTSATRTRRSRHERHASPQPIMDKRGEPHMKRLRGAALAARQHRPRQRHRLGPAALALSSPAPAARRPTPTSPASASGSRRWPTSRPRSRRWRAGARPRPRPPRRPATRSPRATIISWRRSIGARRNGPTTRTTSRTSPAI